MLPTVTRSLASQARKLDSIFRTLSSLLDLWFLKLVLVISEQFLSRCQDGMSIFQYYLKVIIAIPKVANLPTAS